MKRFKNYALWLAVFSFIPLLSQSLGFNLPGNYDSLVNGILSILVLCGLINDPTTQNKGFFDDK